ncbi:MULTISPECIES: tRNA lysidine(34) synthetase TilS [unclassified Moraxella]|uniref:tRNA lysidine(34) synthetase TilS n=1 Tax=unclassified Moraxella TaxID=2685852 RepID=UPI003AF9C930
MPMRAITLAIQNSHARYIPLNAPIYIACSGGRDSMALLFACHQLGLPIHVIHINHKIQSPSDAWQQLVEDFCQTHQIPYQSHCLSWQQSTFKANISEAQARTARYQAIASLVPTGAIIATAHHANDQAETLLMNLCKGTGLTGLVGISEWGEQHEFGKPLWLWRPLLGVTREQISAFVTAHQLPYVNDPTNVGDANQRAFLREQIFPLLNQRFGNLIDNIHRTQTNLAEAKIILDEQVQQDLQTCELAQISTPYQQQLDIGKLKTLSQPRRFAVLHSWVKGDEKFAPHRQLVEQIEQLIGNDDPNQQTILVWQMFEIRRYRQRLYRMNTEYYQSDSKNLESIIIPPTIGYLRPLMANEKLQRLGHDYHEPFKKICQRLDIPSWERDLARIINDTQHRPLALLLPYSLLDKQIVWLADSQSLNSEQKQILTAILHQL